MLTCLQHQSQVSASQHQLDLINPSRSITKEDEAYLRDYTLAASVISWDSGTFGTSLQVTAGDITNIAFAGDTIAFLDSVGYSKRSMENVNRNQSLMKAYSTDLRQKVIDAYNNQEASQRQLAKRFSVSLSFVQDLLKRYRSDNTIEPLPHGGGHSAKLSPQQVAVVATLIEEDNDAILVELCDRLEQRTGVKVSRATMGRITQKLNLTRKKKHCTRTLETRSGCKS